MATLKDIAWEAGVSITTVSNVVHNRASRVSPELVRRIREIMEREHYVPSMMARTLANRESLIIGVINRLVKEQVGGVMADPFHVSFMGGIEHETRKEGYFLMLRSVEDTDALEKLRRGWSMDGMIFTGMFRDEFFEHVQSMQLPYVLIDSYIDLPDVWNVGLEDEKGGYLATKCLLEHGHRCIAFACPEIRKDGVVEKRLIGYRRALEEFGVAYDPSLVFQQEITIPEGIELGRKLAARKEITGIFASADILAAGILAGLREAGARVPEEKSVVGFDDHYLCQLTTPALTTIHQDAEQKGILAVQMLLSQLRGEPVEEHQVILPVHLVERGSVADYKPQ